jgi:hypothetical protein
MRLDNFVSGDRPAPQLIKVDVEGAASEVLIGALETIRTSGPTLIIEIHTCLEYEEVVQFLEPLGYELAWNIPPEGFPRQCFAFRRPLVSRKWEATASPRRGR